MVAQGPSCIEGKVEYTKHMIRMHHVRQAQAEPEANKIIPINSHDWASSYQMLAEIFSFGHVVDASDARASDSKRSCMHSA